MPTILRIANFRFHFYSNKSNEPAHIHVRCADGECKFWLEAVALASNRGIAPHDLKEKRDGAQYLSFPRWSMRMIGVRR